MWVWCDPSIVAIRASEIGQLPDLTDVTEKRKITVDSSETDVRVDLSKIPLDDLFWISEIPWWILADGCI